MNPSDKSVEALRTDLALLLSRFDKDPSYAERFHNVGTLVKQLKSLQVLLEKNVVDSRQVQRLLMGIGRVSTDSVHFEQSDIYGQFARFFARADKLFPVPRS